MFGPDGTWIKYISGPGFKLGEVAEPSGIAISADGNILVCEAQSHRVQIFNPTTGESIGIFGDNGDLLRPSALVVDPCGNILVADTGNKRIQVSTHPQIIHPAPCS
jgi:DNA-binding beta-propeller fold protein YncE